MKDLDRKLVLRLQRELADWVHPGFSDAELSALNSLIVLAVDGRDYFQETAPDKYKGSDNEYRALSIFACLESYFDVSQALRVLIGWTEGEELALNSTLEGLRNLFLCDYLLFESTGDMLIRMQLLLRLFKMQLVFASLTIR